MARRTPTSSATPQTFAAATAATAAAVATVGSDPAAAAAVGSDPAAAATPPRAAATEGGLAPLRSRPSPPPAAVHAGSVCASARRMRASSRAPLS